MQRKRSSMTMLEQTGGDTDTVDADQSRHPQRTRGRGRMLVIGSSVLAMLIVVGGGGTTAIWAARAWNATEAAHAKAVKAAETLQASDVKARHDYDVLLKKVQVMHVLLVRLEAIAGPAEWVSKSTYNDLDNARGSTYTTNVTPGLAVADPRPKKTDGMFITDIVAETKRLQKFVAIHQADLDDTVNSNTFLRRSVDIATTAVNELLQEAAAAGENISTG